MSQAYHRYALNYINALNYLETLRRQGEFNEFEKVCQPNFVLLYPLKKNSIRLKNDSVAVNLTVRAFF